MKRRVAILYSRVNQAFSATLAGGSESDDRWQAIKYLRHHGIRLVFENARDWISATNPRRRETAAQVLCQLRHPHRRGAKLPSPTVFVAESFELLAAALQTETDRNTQLAIIYGFGHLRLPAAVPLILPFTQHAEADMRFATTCALGSFYDDPAAVTALTKLMEDPDKDVRDWAIFGVGTQGNADTPELREAFIRHLDDPYFDCRLEATESLAKRHDLRVVRPLISQLQRYGDIYTLCEAADLLLGMNERPDPKWSAEQYIAALQSNFPAGSVPGSAALLDIP